MKRWSVLMLVCGILVLGAGCGFVDWFTGTREVEEVTEERTEIVDPETGEKKIVVQPVKTIRIESDPEGSPLALLAGLLGAGQIGTGLAGLWGAARGKKYKTIGAAAAKTARRLWDKRQTIKDADGKERVVIFADEGAGFLGEFATDQDKAGIRQEARSLIHKVESGQLAKLVGDA